MANEYAEMQRHLDALKTERNRAKWVADFNAIAQEIEEEIKHDLTGAQDQVSLPPWEARLEDGTIWLYSPPFVRKSTGTMFEAVRLALNADKPIIGIHVNARSVPVNADFKITGQKQFVCTIINTNAEQIEEHPLVAVWFLWDSIARIGIAKGLENGLITRHWVDHVFEHAQECAGQYPHSYYKHGNAANEYLITLYRLCATRGITQAMLHGEGGRENAGTKRNWKAGHYTNTWIDEHGVCECCPFTKDKPLSYGTKNYPYGSLLGHVQSVRHCRNAAEYLLKMSQDKATKSVKSGRVAKPRPRKK